MDVAVRVERAAEEETTATGAVVATAATGEAVAATEVTCTAFIGEGACMAFVCNAAELEASTLDGVAAGNVLLMARGGVIDGVAAGCVDVDDASYDDES